MQKIIFNTFLGLICFYSSCSQAQDLGAPVEEPKAILKNINAFLSYSDTYLKLSEDYIPLDSLSKIIDKGDFLQQLSSGLYLPLRLASNNAVYYKLHKINTPTDDYIALLIKSMAQVEYKHYQMEGKPIPAFNFTDLEGRRYNEETMKEKIVVLKFWFIKCQKCIEEMPALNKLVKQYKNRKDIVFVSLAFDEENLLKKFLSKTTFDYPVVASQEDYLNKTLDISSYPTHVVINKKGFVVKMVNSYIKMEAALKKEASN